MNILCCDTSTDLAVFAVGVAPPDGKVRCLASASESHRRNLSTLFFQMMQTVLDEAGLSFDEIDVLGVGIGPGSFTGVRIAVATFRTLAQASGKKLVGVGALDAMALSAGDAAAVVTLLPSRRGEVYLAGYRNGSAAVAPQAAATDAIVGIGESLGLETVYVGPRDQLPPEPPAARRIVVDGPAPESLLRLAAHEAAAGRWADPFALNPSYVVAPAISQHKMRDADRRNYEDT